MFGDLLGNMEEQQKALKEKLATIKVEDEIQDGAIKVVANANSELEQLTISPDLLSKAEPEELEDLLLVLLNRVLESAREKQASEAQNSIKGMLPPGLDNLFG